VNALAVANGAIAVPMSNSLKMIDEATGSDLWTWAAPADVFLTSNVVMTKNMVFVASRERLFAIDRISGQLGWSEFVGSDVSEYFSSYNLAYFDGTLYASGISRIMAYNAVPEPSGILVGSTGIIFILGRVFSQRRRRLS